MPTILINPFDEVAREQRPAAARLSALSGKTIGLLDISKPGGNHFLDHLENLLRQQAGVAEVVRVMKPTFTKPAPAEVIEALAARCDAVVEALAD
ncbi:MAG: hypothetical protein ACKV2V_19680 [Blastocatellia bacterium]